MSGIEGASAMSAIQQASVRTEISFALAAKQLDTQKQLGQAAVELIESAAQLAKEVGKGGQIDSIA